MSAIKWNQIQNYVLYRCCLKFMSLESIDILSRCECDGFCRYMVIWHLVKNLRTKSWMESRPRLQSAFFLWACGNEANLSLHSVWVLCSGHFVHLCAANTFLEEYSFGDCFQVWTWNTIFDPKKKKKKSQYKYAYSCLLSSKIFLFSILQKSSSDNFYFYLSFYFIFYITKTKNIYF